MPQDPFSPTSPYAYRDYVGDTERNAPPLPSPYDGTNGDGVDGKAKPFKITSELLDQLGAGSKKPLHAWNITDPYAMAERYMVGPGHSGYVGPNSEDYNAYRQGIGVKWINGAAKFLGNTFATAVSGTVGMFNGFGDVLASPFIQGHFDFSKFYDNYTNNQMEDLTQYMEKIFPHYETTRQREAVWYSPDNWFTANFWANGFLKNAGFAAGALLTGKLAAYAVTKIPEMTKWALAVRRAFETGDFARDARLMEQALGVLGDVDDVVRANKIAEILKDASKLDELGISAERMAKVFNWENKVKSGFQKQFISVMGAVGESSMEAVQGIHSIRQQLIDDYRDKHDGDLPGIADMEDIESKARNGANWRWWLNLATLTVTNNIQFPRLLGNNVKNQMGILTHEVEDIVAIEGENKIVGDIVKAGSKQKYASRAAIDAAKRSGAMKIVNPVWQFMKNPIVASESAEEGLQYMYEKGTESYEAMQFDGKASNLFKSIIMDGTYALFHDKEGWESMLFGGLTGKIMDMTLGRGEKARKQQNTAKLLAIENSEQHTIAGLITGDAKYEAAVRTATTPYMDAVTAAAVRHQALTAEHNTAVAKGDVNTMRDRDEDLIHNYAMPRLTYGRKDVFKGELRQYLSTNMPFEEARKLLNLPEEVTSEDLDAAINRRIKQVDQIDTLREFVMGTFGSARNKDGQAKYTEGVLNNMIYTLFKVDSHDDRYNKLVNEITAATGVDMSELTSYHKREIEGAKGSHIETHRDLDTIRNEIGKGVRDAVRNNPKLEKDDQGISIFDKLRDLESIQNTRERFVKEYHSLREKTTDSTGFDPYKPMDRKQLEELEEETQYNVLAENLQKATNARNLATKMSRILEALDDKQMDVVLTKLAELEKLMGEEDNFIYDDEAQYLKDLVGKLRDKVFEEAKSQATAPAIPVPGLEGLPREQAIEFIARALSEQDRIQQQHNAYNETEPLPYTDDQVQYMEELREAYAVASLPLDRIDKVLATLTGKEPRTNLLSEVKRQIADRIANQAGNYDAIAQVIDNPDYIDVAEIKRLIEMFTDMKEWYGDRKELLATKAFNQYIDKHTGQVVIEPFLETLDKRIKQLNDWLDITKKRMENFLRDDSEYYRGRVQGQWTSLGINPEAEIEAPKVEEKKAEEKKEEAVPAPAVTGIAYIHNKALYDLVAAIVGEDVLLAEYAKYRAAYAEHLADRKKSYDFKKFSLGIIERIRSADNSTNKQAYTRLLEDMVKSPVTFMTEQSFESKIAKAGAGAYEALISNYYNGEVRLLKHLFDEQAYPPSVIEYKRHRDLKRFIKELKDDITNGVALNSVMPGDWLISLFTHIEAAMNARTTSNMLNSNRSLSDMYMSLKNTINEQMLKGNPIPSDRQLLGIMDILVHAYNKTISATTAYDPMIYLDGRIGSGKTAMANILLRTLGNMEGSVINMQALLAGDSNKVGLNLERTLGMDQTKGKGASIQDVIKFLNGEGDLFDRGNLKFIVIDEAARAFKQLAELATAVQKFNHDNKKDVRVFLLGDTQQVTGGKSNLDTIGANKAIHLATAFTTPFRGKVSSINNMHSTFVNAGNKDLRGQMLTFTSNIAAPWDSKEVSNRDGLLVGVSGSRPNMDRNKRIEDVIKVLQNRKGVTVDGKPLRKAIIVNRTLQQKPDGSFEKDENGNPIDTGGKIKEWEERLLQQGLESEFTVVNFYDAQGDTFDEVYLDLEVDNNDPLIDDVELYNTAMYTAGRARNFLYLINHNIDTTLDPGLEKAFMSSTDVINESSATQFAKVAQIAAYLDVIKPSTIKKTTVQAADTKDDKGEKPPDTGTEGQELEKDKKHVPNNEDDKDDNDENPDGEVYDRKDPIAVRMPPVNGKRDGTILGRISNRLYVTEEGKIGIDLDYPTGLALHWYNNLIRPGQTDSHNRVMPAVGEKIYIVSMPPDKNKGPYKYGVFRFTGVGNMHQLMAVLSTEEVEGTTESKGLVHLIPEFRTYHEQVLKDNKNSDLMKQGGTFKVVQVKDDKLPHGTGINSFWNINLPSPGPDRSALDIREDELDKGAVEKQPVIPEYLRGSIIELAELEYQYDPRINSSLVNLNAAGDGLDFIKTGVVRKGTGTTEKSILEIWYNDFYRVDPATGKATVPGAPDYDYIKKNAAVYIQTIDTNEYQQLTNREKNKDAPYTPKTVPVNLGDTYLRIELPKITGYIKPQFIKLEGAILNEAFGLHKKMYLEPMRNFIEAAKVLTARLNGFILNVMKEDPAAFEALWRGNKYATEGQTEAGTTVKMEFKRDDAKAFDTSSLIFNDLVKRMINMQWEDTSTIKDTKKLKNLRNDLGDNFAQNDPQTEKLIQFYNRFFKALRDPKIKRDHEFSELARNMRLAQKEQLPVRKGGALTKEQRAKLKAAGKADDREVVMVTYSDGRQKPMLDLAAVRGDTVSQAGERRAQVAFINLAQANGFLTNPITGQKVSILQWRKESVKDQSGNSLDHVVRTAYDLMRDKFGFVKLTKEEGGKKVESDDLYYIVAAYNASKAMNPQGTPMDVNVHQLKGLLDFLVKGNYFAALREADPDSYAHKFDKKGMGIKDLYIKVQGEQAKNETGPYTKLFNETVYHAIENYTTAPLSVPELDAIFGAEAFEGGVHKNNLRVNIPLWLSNRRRGKISGWTDPADPTSTNALSAATIQERIGQMLSTHFTGVKPTKIAVEINHPAPADSVTGTNPDPADIRPTEEGDPGVITGIVPPTGRKGGRPIGSRNKKVKEETPVEGKTITIKTGKSAAISEWMSKEYGSWEDSEKSPDHAYAILQRFGRNLTLTVEEARTLLESGRYQSTAWNDDEIAGGKTTKRTIARYVEKLNEALIELGVDVPAAQQPVEKTGAPATDDEAKKNKEGATQEDINNGIRKEGEGIGENISVPAQQGTALTAQQILDAAAKALDPTAGLFHGTPAGRQLTESAARKYLKKMVPGITDDMIDFLDKMGMLNHMESIDAKGHEGLNIFGVVHKGAVAFQKGEDGTVYSNVVKHEAFHLIFKYFTSPELRSRIYNAAVHFYGLEYTDPESIEEHLAIEYGNRRDSWIPAIIRSFFNWLAEKLGFITEHEYFIKDYFLKIEKGAFTERTDMPNDGTAFYTKFAQYYKSDFNLFQKVWGTFARDVQQYTHDGRDVRINVGTPEEETVSMPMGDDEIINILTENKDDKGLYKQYRKALNTSTFETLDPTIKALLEISTPEEFKEKRDIYERLGNDTIFYDMVQAAYPDRFRFSTEDGHTYQKYLEDRETEHETKIVAVGTDAELDSRIVANLNMNAEIKSDSEIDPRETLSDRVHLYLQTITDDKGNPVPEDYSIYTLYDSVHNLPLDMRHKPKEMVINQLARSFGKGTIYYTPYPEHVEKAIAALQDIRNKYGYTSAKVRIELRNEVAREMEVLREHYRTVIKNTKNPNTKFSLLSGSRDIKTIYDTITIDMAAMLPYPNETQQSRDKREVEIVTKNLDKLLEITEDNKPMKATGHVFRQALFDSLRRLVIDAYNTSYVIRGQAPVAFEGNKGFVSDDIFLYDKYEIVRNGDTNEVFFQKILNVIHSRNNPTDPDGDYHMKDVIAVWKKRKAYNTFSDLMGVVDNSYTTKPYRLIIKEVRKYGKSVYKQNLQNVNISDAEEAFGREIIAKVGDKILVSDEKGKRSFNKNIFEGLYETLKSGTDEELVTEFYAETVGPKPGLVFSESSLQDAADAVKFILQGIENIVTAKVPADPDNFDVEQKVFTGKKGFLKKLTGPLLDTSSDKNNNTYRNGEGNQVSSIRHLSYADTILAMIRAFTEEVRTAESKGIILNAAPYLDKIVAMSANNKVAFLKMNPLNPFGIFSNTALSIGDSRLFDAHKSTDRTGTEWVTAYSGENMKDMMSRLLVGNYMMAISQPNLFEIGKTQRNTKKISTIQPFYIMAEKKRSQGYEMELISDLDFDNHIGQLLFQILNRPLKTYTKEVKDKNGNVTGTVSPYNNKDYNPYYSPFDDKTLNESQIEKLRKKWEPDMQKALNDDIASRHEEFPAFVKLLEKFKKDTAIKRIIGKIKEDFKQEAEKNLDFIINGIERDSNYKKIDEPVILPSGEVAKNPDGTTMTRERYKRSIRRDTGFRIPDNDLLRTTYENLFKEDYLSAKDITELSNGKVTVDPVTKQIVITGYNGDLRDVQIEKDHLRPLMHHFVVNHYIRGYYLAQITMDDNSVYGSAEKITKRMGITQGGGRAYYNMGNILGEEEEFGQPPDAMKFTVIDDVIYHRNLDKNITDENYQAGKWNELLPDTISKDIAEQVQKDLSPMSQLSNPQFKNLLKAFAALNVSKDVVAKLIEDYNSLNLSKNTINDGAGLMTERSHNRLKHAGGPAMNTQDILKPLVMGRDVYGVARNSKFAVEVLTDEVVALWPAYLSLRIDADFGFLNREGTRPLYERAKELEAKRINLFRTGMKTGKHSLLSIEEDHELERIYRSSRNRPTHVIVPRSAVKFNAPAKAVGYDYISNTFKAMDHAAHNDSSFTLTMRDFRIQQEPVNDPSHGSVAMFTQLLYMSDTNGNNKAERDALFRGYSEIQRMGFDELLEDYPIKTLSGPVTSEQMRANLLSIIKLMIDRYDNNPAKTRELEILKRSVAGANDPSVVNDLYTQLMATVKRATGGHRMEGRKFVQLSSMARRLALRANEVNLGSFREPKYDVETNTAEIYLPEIYLNSMRKQYPELSDEELMKRIPITFAFRVPSTGINSACRVKVIGFYPSKINAIIGPADETLIMGSDFDVDALFMLMPTMGKAGKGETKKAFEYGLSLLYNGKYNNTPIGFNTVLTRAGYELEPIEGFEEKIRKLYNAATGERRKGFRAIYRAYRDNDMIHQYVKILGKDVNRKDVLHILSFESANSMLKEDSLFNQRASALNPKYATAWKTAYENGSLFFNDRIRDDLEDWRYRILGSEYDTNMLSGYIAIQLDTMGGANLIGIEAKATQTMAYLSYSVNPGETIHVMNRLAFEYDGHRQQIGGVNEKTGAYEMFVGSETDRQSLFDILQWITNSALDATKEGILPVLNLTRVTANAWTAGLSLKMTTQAMQSFMNLAVIKELSGYSRMNESTIYTMRRELLAMREANTTEERRISYAKYDSVPRNKQKTLESLTESDDLIDNAPNKGVAEKVKNIMMTHEQTRKLEQYRDLFAVRKAYDEKKLTKQEYLDIIDYNLKALETFEKLNEIGDAFFKTQRVTNIILGSPIEYGEYQKYLKDFYGMYSSSPEMALITNSIDRNKKGERVQTYRRALKYDKKTGLPIVKKGFPIKGINLFRIDHFKSSFDSYQYYHDATKATFLKHNPIVEDAALIIVKEFDLAKLDKDRTESVEIVKSEIIGYMFGLTKFTNSDGTPTKISTFEEKPYTYQGWEFTGAQAYMQRFISKIQDLKTNPLYRKNEFIRRLKIETDLHGVRRLKYRKLTGLPPAVMAGLTHQFKMLDQEERTTRDMTKDKKDAYWYSELQIEFLKYAILDNRLAFGSTNYSQLLPEDMKAIVTDDLLHTMTALISNNRVTTAPGKGTDEDEEGEAEEQEQTLVTNPLLDTIWQNIGFKVLLNNPGAITSMHYEDNPEYVTAAARERPENADKKVTYYLKRDDKQEVFYNIKLHSAGNTQGLGQRYRMFVNNLNPNNGRHELFMRVKAFEDPEVKGIYTAYYRYVGLGEDTKGMQGNLDAVLLGWNIQEQYPEDIPQFFRRQVDEPVLDENLLVVTPERLVVNTEMERGQIVMLTENGDYTMEKAELYRVTKVDRVPDRERLKEINEELRETDSIENRGERIRARNKLYEERKKQYGSYQLERMGTATGIRAMKTLAKTLEKAETQEKEIRTLLDDKTRMLDLSVLFKKLEPTAMTEEEKQVFTAIMLGQLPQEGAIGEEDCTKSGGK